MQERELQDGAEPTGNIENKELPHRQGKGYKRQRWDLLSPLPSKRATVSPAWIFPTFPTPPGPMAGPEATRDRHGCWSEREPRTLPLGRAAQAQEL